MFKNFLGKDRSPLGSFIDRNHRLSQEILAKETKLSRNTISDLCKGDSRRPQIQTQQKIVSALRKLGYNVSTSDFW
ncbi:hypothetical protein GCM10010451_68350 [Streptomyces virens]|uniref:HTH cro/C1-type domain-containing protein n=1 Tax=Streptomyces virens TaxID=285572 RepID=A0ABN3V115_9ACTN